MPTYEYRCDSCGHEFELFQSMTDPVKRKCPKCAQLKLKRLVGTGAGIIFKGSGFYETDYRSDSYTKAADAEKKAGSETKSDKSDNAKSDAGDAPKSKPESTETPADTRPTNKKSQRKK